MRVIVIVQARMGSERFPGKVMKRIKGKPLLGYMLERIQRMQYIDEIVVASTESMDDQVIVDYCQRLGVKWYRGSTNDVLSRYYEVAVREAAQVIVRLTADCPLIDPFILDNMVVNFVAAQPNLDYMSNTVSRSFPRGFDCEILSFEALEETYNKAKLPMEREHVTPYIYLRWSLFRVANYFSILGDHSNYRLTVDYPEDFKLISKIITELTPTNPEFGLKDVLNFLEKNPKIAKINAHLTQKKLSSS